MIDVIFFSSPMSIHDSPKFKIPIDTTVINTTKNIFGRFTLITPKPVFFTSYIDTIDK